MASIICPTILADTQTAFRKQIERVTSFTPRIHIDLADGAFAESKTIPIADVWWPHGVAADLHVMYQQPFEHTAALLRLKPQLIIVHAESKGDFISFAKEARRQNIRVGVALLPATSPEVLRPALKWIDHVLVFSGSLGHFGGHADLRLLPKVKHIQQMKPELEIGWDGGVNSRNARALAMTGVDVLYAGKYISEASSPQSAYELLEKKITAPVPA
jgi:ribulose-phosphate 3-epimerase